MNTPYAVPISDPLQGPGGRVARRDTHRRTFLAAGIYNIVWGLVGIVAPQWFFEVARMPPANHPQVFATLGMVLALYGILYLEVARVPEHGWPIAAVGFTGKILGPIGLTYLLVTGRWPLASIVICTTNDVIWWIPFGRYLRDAWPIFKRSINTQK
jgi:hypothetical protein